MHVVDHYGPHPTIMASLLCGTPTAVVAVLLAKQLGYLTLGDTLWVDIAHPQRSDSKTILTT